MRITKKSTLTGVEHTKEINVTPEQLRSWEEGELIQRAMPHLDPDEREFLISGSTAEEWEEAFPTEDESL